MALPERPEMRFRTKQEYVYQCLRQAIMRCELLPGERLVIDELARRLEVSAIPVREALQLLQSEGLVVIEPHVGAEVAPISEAAIDEAFAIMEGLETVAVRGAIRRLADADADELVGLVGLMDDAVAAGEHERWAELNTRLHRRMSEIAAMPLLREMTERVLARWERLRRYYFKGVLVPRVEQAQREHRVLLEAIVARDTERAEQVVREHNRAARAAYAQYLGSLDDVSRAEPDLGRSSF
ncbi:MAG: GntR family transcriptional regulator [Betaproteobacteria bacterium]